MHDDHDHCSQPTFLRALSEACVTLEDFIVKPGRVTSLSSLKLLWLRQNVAHEQIFDDYHQKQISSSKTSSSTFKKPSEVYDTIRQQTNHSKAAQG